MPPSDSARWFVDSLSQKGLEPQTRDLFENYSHIPREQVIPHIEAIRNRAWQIFPYPCVGRFHFLETSLSQHPSYAYILSLFTTTTTSSDPAPLYLDIGCCFGQDIRRLVHDGANPDLLHGTDLSPDFLSLGYDLFRDRETLTCQFFAADVLADDGQTELNQLRGRVDVVHAASFFHLFSLETQRVAATKVLALLRPGKGAMIVGRQGGDLNSREFEHENGKKEEGKDEPMKKLFWHNSETWRDMWEGVARESGREIEVQSELQVDHKVFKASDDDGRKHGPNTRRMVFCIKTLS